MSDIDIKIKMKDGKPEFQYAPIEAKKVDPDDALECDIKNEMSGSYGSKSRSEAIGSLAYSAASAAGTKGLSHKLKSDIHAHASSLHAKAAEAYDADGDNDASGQGMFKSGASMSKHHKEMSDRHSKISAEMMK